MVVFKYMKPIFPLLGQPDDTSQVRCRGVITSRSWSLCAGVVPFDVPFDLASLLAVLILRA